KAPYLTIILGVIPLKKTRSKFTQLSDNIGAITIQQWEFPQLFLTVGLMLFFSTWIIILSDMVKNKIYNKAFWILTMFIMPAITTIFYLIQRNKLLRLGQRVY
ncbi:PLDc N-terminal domain-containing protein, partial [Cyclobacterium jeungdonense]